MLYDVKAIHAKSTSINQLPEIKKSLTSLMIQNLKFQEPTLWIRAGSYFQNRIILFFLEKFHQLLSNQGMVQNEKGISKGISYPCL